MPRSELSLEGCSKERPSQQEVSELQPSAKGRGQTFLAQWAYPMGSLIAWLSHPAELSRLAQILFCVFETLP